MGTHFTIDPARIAANRRRNAIHAGLLIGTMVLLVAAVGWFFAGPLGVIWIAALAAVVLAVGPRLSQQVMLQLYSASELKRSQVPLLYDLVNLFRERSGISQTVRLYYIPSHLMLAFTIGGGNTVSIAVSDGLLRGLTGREIAGVLAHELSHVVHGDLKLMVLADFVTKITRTMALVALLLIALNLPSLVEKDVAIPWAPVALLAVAPLISLLLQLGLSRSREYNADTGAAMLTGDPEAVASALEKMEARQHKDWEARLGRQGLVVEPSLLRTHPHTQARVRHLHQLSVPADIERPETPSEVTPPDDRKPVKPPRRRMHGFRY